MKQHLTRRRRSLALGAAVVSAALLLGGCASQQQAEGSGGSATAGTDYYAAAVAEAKSLAKDQKLAPSLSMLGVNSGVEGQTLQQLYKAFTEGTGTKVNYTGSADTANLVQSRVQAGNPPDLADIAMGSAADYARQGKLVDLSKVMGDELKKNFSAGLLDAASADGKVFGVYQGFNNFMLWYNPQQYTGPKDPSTWKEMLSWTEDLAAKGTPAWCAAQNSGAFSGAPARQFIENIFLKEFGPDLYRQWGEGKLSFTSPQVKSAFEQFGALIGDDSHVSGGINGILSTPNATGYNGLVAEPATCQVALWGSWTPGLIGTSAQPGKNIDFFRVPATDEKFKNDEMFQSTTTVAFTDNATTRAFVKFLASDAAQTYLASLGRWPVANLNVPVKAYPTEVLQKIAKTYFGTSDTQLHAGPNSLAPSSTLIAFQKGVLSYLQNPSSLDSVLETIQSAVK